MKVLKAVLQGKDVLTVFHQSFVTEEPVNVVACVESFCI